MPSAFGTMKLAVNGDVAGQAVVRPKAPGERGKVWVGQNLVQTISRWTMDDGRRARRDVPLKAILYGVRKRWLCVEHLFADGACDRLKLMDKASYPDFVVEITRRSDDHKGFKVRPRRWVVESTFWWLIRKRRLVRDDEQRIAVSHAMIMIAMRGVILRRNADPSFFKRNPGPSTASRVCRMT